MTVESQALPLPGNALDAILEEAARGTRQEDRSQPRYSFFRPVTILLDNGTTCAGFSRDVSEDGIGLIHNGELPLTEVDVRIAHGGDSFVMVRTRILWSRTCAGPWCASGGSFVSSE